MVAVMVENDSTMVQNIQHSTNHSDFAFFFFEKVELDTSLLNKPTRKLNRSINGGVLSYSMLYDSLKSWLSSMKIKECKGSTCLEDALIGSLQHVLSLDAYDIAMIVHQFHAGRVFNKVSSKSLPEHVWLKIILSRKGQNKDSSMGLGRDFYFEH